MRNFIPEKMQFHHQYCFFLHDLLASIIATGESKGAFGMAIHLTKPEDIKELSAKKGDDIFLWLKANGYGDTADLMDCRQICVALLADFCHFVYEALNCSRKGKLTVTYSLLRKPFKDNLFYLEWLLADTPDFINHFHSTDSDPLAIQSVSVERKKAIILGAMEKTTFGQWMPSDFMYELRFDKSADFGLEQLWQKANHLITSFRTMKTEGNNFNFVFSGDDAKLSQWQHLYTLLPLLLFHAVQVANALVAEFIDEPDIINETDSFRATTGLMLWMKSNLGETYWGEVNKIIFDDKDLGMLECPLCKKQLNFDTPLLESLCIYGEFHCNDCGFKLDMYRTKEIGFWKSLWFRLVWFLKKMKARFSKSVKKEEKKVVAKAAKRQHYISRFYLRHFAEPVFSDNICVYDLKKQKWETNRTPRGIGWFPHLYSMIDIDGKRRDDFDKFLKQEVEDPAAPALKKMAMNEKLDEDERSAVALFIALTAARSPEFINETLEGHLDRLAQEDRTELDDLVKRWCEWTGKPYDSRSHLECLKPGCFGGIWEWSQSFRNRLLQWEWHLVTTTRQRPFVTSDRPVYAEWDRDQDMRIVSFPISSEVALVVVTGGQFNHSRASANDVSAMNRQTINRASEFVVACKESFPGDEFLVRRS